MQKKVDISNAETIEPIGEVRTIGSKEVGESPEERAAREDELKQQKIEEAKQKAKEIAEKMVKRQFRTMFLQVYDKVQNQGKALEEVIDEVNKKKSNMTRSARDFVLNFEPDRIKQWIEDENKERQEALNKQLEKQGIKVEKTDE